MTNAIDKIAKIKENIHPPLLKVSSIFPFHLFPDKLIIDREKISLIRRHSLLNKKVFPILISDLKTVTLNTSLLFGSLQFEIAGYETNPEPLIFLPKRKAVKAKRIIEALIIFKSKNIDVSKISNKKLINKCLSIGKELEEV